MTRSYSDQLGNQITLADPPQRIVSLVPSQTELLYDLGLGPRVVGITKFCVHPAHWLREKAIVGGTKNFHLDLIEKLVPDLIIGNKEENYRQGIEALQAKFPVWMSDIVSLQDAIEMIRHVGALTGTQARADEITQQIRNAFSHLKKRAAKRVLYLIWRKPWMAAGRQTFINSMLEACGWENCLSELRYPSLTDADIISLRPDVIFLSSEPYPFNDSHHMELNAIVPSPATISVDGEMFSWYGSRLIKAPEYFNALQI